MTTTLQDMAKKNGRSRQGYEKHDCESQRVWDGWIRLARFNLR